MEVIFWSEFPENVNWAQVKKLIDFKTKVYVAVKEKKEYERLSRKIRTKNIEVGVWPKLSDDEGYWFSGFVRKTSIDKLKEFNGLDMKIDIEPPFPGKHLKKVKLFFMYFLPHVIRSGKNNAYLEGVLKGLKGNIIISGFPLPAWITRRYGDVTLLQKNMEKNFISYTTITCRFLSRLYIKNFVKYAIKRYGNKAVFAVGCTGRGVFGNEKTYSNIKEFKDDLMLIKKAGAKKIAVFSIEGIMERSDKIDWLKEIKRVIYG